jgi:hypothetical protein
MRPPQQGQIVDKANASARLAAASPFGALSRRPKPAKKLSGGCENGASEITFLSPRLSPDGLIGLNRFL